MQLHRKKKKIRQSIFANRPTFHELRAIIVAATTFLSKGVTNAYLINRSADYRVIPRNDCANPPIPLSYQPPSDFSKTRRDELLSNSSQTFSISREFQVELQSLARERERERERERLAAVITCTRISGPADSGQKRHEPTERNEERATSRANGEK